MSKTDKTTLRRTLHLDEIDLPLLSPEIASKLLSHKFILRTSHNSAAGKKQVEEIFSWLRDTCESYFMVRGPEQDDDGIKYYIYFADELEAAQFKLTFPT